MPPSEVGPRGWWREHLAENSTGEVRVKDGVVDIPSGLTSAEEWLAIRRGQGKEVKVALVDWVVDMGEWCTKADLTFTSLAHPERAEKAVRRFKRIISPGGIMLVGYERQERWATHAHILDSQRVDCALAEEVWQGIGGPRPGTAGEGGWCRVEEVESLEAAVAYLVKHGVKGLDYEILRPGDEGPWPQEDREERRIVGKGVCVVCGEAKVLEEHHLDWHHENEEESNKVEVCRRCHVALHRVGYLTREELAGVREMVERRR